MFISFEKNWGEVRMKWDSGLNSVFGWCTNHPYPNFGYLKFGQGLARMLENGQTAMACQKLATVQLKPNTLVLPNFFCESVLGTNTRTCMCLHEKHSTLYHVLYFYWFNLFYKLLATYKGCPIRIYRTPSFQIAYIYIVSFLCAIAFMFCTSIGSTCLTSW